MEMIAPAGPVYQAGALSGNPLAMASAKATLEKLKDPKAYQRLTHTSKKVVEGIRNVAREAGHAICSGFVGGMLGFSFTDGPVPIFTDAKKSDLKKFGKFHPAMLGRGIYLAPGQCEALF